MPLDCVVASRDASMDRVVYNIFVLWRLVIPTIWRFHVYSSHKYDLNRIGERMATIFIMLDAALCRKLLNEKICGVVSDSDTSGIEPSNERVYYCAHDSRVYLFEGGLQILTETMERLVRMEDFI